MRASRLLSIVLLLQSEGKMSSKQLAERLEVNVRTILRDMDELSSSGVPVYSERGQHGGWQLSEGYRTSLTGIHPDELAALLVSSQAEPLSDLGQLKQLDTAMQKILAATTEAARSNAAAVRKKIHIDGASWYASSNQVISGKSLLAVVQEALWQNRALKLTYQREEMQVERTVLPLGLVAKRSIWYLVAKTSEDELRTFRISRLLSVEVLPDSFTPPSDFDLALYWQQSLVQFKESLPRYPARIKLKQSQLQRLQNERFVAIGIARSVQEGWLEADVTFETIDSACEMILSYGARIEVLEPADLRQLVMDEIETMRMVYL
ncbi:YafY family transcriptional regulator [Paenibacillus sp. GSMTC-2017]|uniref:helix-turn-helix transcriptional regulator n=1 Tax=Paenibacillus sp. GSMTC-2017 TaxID=2794350 RepID=UPI0018D97C18|nr:YafY family protein [Paenibacillus sp. GSMTC-2017]MBH5319984.1 YafY family transcriptional regulator [Paenibacillus sp. GSMTC-2017]